MFYFLDDIGWNWCIFQNTCKKTTKFAIQFCVETNINVDNIHDLHNSFERFLVYVNNLGHFNYLFWLHIPTNCWELVDLLGQSMKK